MSPELQTVIALAIVAGTVAVLVYNTFFKKRRPGCSSGGACGSVSPEVKKLQARLKR